MMLSSAIPLNSAVERRTVRDGRARFRAVLDAVNARWGTALPDYRPTDDILRRFAGEGEDVAPLFVDDLPRLPGSVHVVAAPGFLTECVTFMADVLTDGLAHLERLGAKTTIAPLAGRGGAAHNARQLHRIVMDLSPEETVIIIAMSKGAVDALTMFAEHPETASRVRALVSLVGAVCGSPLYHLAPDWLKWIERAVPLPTCARHGGEAVESLAPEARAAFLRGTVLPAGPRYYSLGAAVGAAGLSKGMIRPYRALSRLDPLNDGQMLLRDQILPDAEFLGVLNADHIAVGMPFNRNMGFPARWVTRHLLDRNAFPREVVVEAVVRRVLADMAS